MFIQEDKAVRWKNLPCELSYYISGLHILRMDTCHTAFNFKGYECCCVSAVNSPELEWEKRGTSRNILLPFSSYHRCPSSKIRPSKPVSPQLLSEVYHIRFFFSVSSRLTKTNFGFCSHALNLGLSSFLGPSLPIHGLQTHVLLSHYKSKVKDFFPSATASITTVYRQNHPSIRWKCTFLFLLRKFQFMSHSLQTQYEREVGLAFARVLPLFNWKQFDMDCVR